MMMVLCTTTSVLAAKGKKRKAAETVPNDEDRHVNRRLEDWEALSRPALELLIQQYHLEPHGTRLELARRLYNNFQVFNVDVDVNNNLESSSVNTNNNPESSSADTNGQGGTSSRNDDRQHTIDNTQLTASLQHNFNALRDELFNLVGVQMNNALSEISKIATTSIQAQQQQQQSSSSPANLVESNGNNNDNNVNAGTNLNVLQVQQSQSQQVSVSNQFRLPSLSASNMALLRAGKFVNFDSLLPGSLAHSSSGYSIQFLSDSRPNGLDGDIPFTFKPNSGKRTIKSFPSWLSAWNIFAQAFCFFFPGFAGSLLAYQSQITIYANRYEFNAWSTYDVHFRQNMANTHPHSSWGEVDRHLFDEILLCAPVLAVCFTCREVGHYHSSCPSRVQAGIQNQPFLAPQRTTSSSRVVQSRAPTSTMLRSGHTSTSNSQPPVCRYFNAGSCTFHSCTFSHLCSICKGNHPATKCNSKSS